MTTPTKLRLLAGFGSSLADALLLACHPDEWDAGQERTLVLTLSQGRPRFVASLPFRSSTAWASPHGAIYLLSWRPGVTNGSVYVHTGDWQQLAQELDATGDRLLQHRIWGLPGATPEDELVFVGGADTTLYVRRGGRWEPFAGPPGCEELNGFHGRAPDEVYLCSPERGLMRWNGQAIELVESPLWAPEGVVVLSDDALVVTHEQSLWRWHREHGWSEQPTDHEPALQPVVLGEEIFSATYGNEGVVRLSPDPEVVAPLGELRSLLDVGDGVIAAGEQGSAFYDGQAWHDIEMPACLPGTNPP
ncbi:MAG: hypothetical protein KDK70_38300 [Myxococcales bacterium]|nr:hypothetical protein [Myxococcales bacterium]